MKDRWDRKGGKDDWEKIFERRERDENETETSGEEDESDDEDVDMLDEAPPLVRVKDFVVPEVDEDGFTKVIKKKR